VLRGFTMAMIWGVLVGTYSSIFIASPLLILLGAKRESVTVAAQKASAAARP
jgi:preprotein translocase subunit SecF